MDFTWLQLVVAFLGSSGIIGGGFTLIKFIYERLDKKKTDKEVKESERLKAEAEERDRTLNRWKELYAELKLENEELKTENGQLKKGDSLAQPTITGIYRAANKIGVEIDILEGIFLKELINCGNDQLSDALKNQIEILKQAHEKLMGRLP